LFGGIIAVFVVVEVGFGIEALAGVGEGLIDGGGIENG
jgi:hypothetical protein